jgi:hypothetical protein
MGSSIRAIGFVMAAGFALAGGVVAATYSVSNAEIVLEVGRTIERARTAEADFQDAQYRFAATTERAATIEGYAAVVTRLGDAVDPAAAAAALDLVEVVADIRTSKAVSEPASAPAGDIPRFHPDMTAEEASAALPRVSRLEAEWSSAVARLNATDDYVSSVLDEAEARLDALRQSAPSAAQALVDAHVSATQASRDAALAAAATASSATDERMDALVAYADAVDALKASHAAEQARLAAEAAAAAAAADASARAGSGGKPRSGGRGGSGSAPGGGSASGGSGGGGAPTAPVDTKRYVEPRGPFTPGCRLGARLYRADPGPGGTSIIGSVDVQYDYRIEGNWVAVYACYL